MTAVQVGMALTCLVSSIIRRIHEHIFESREKDAIDLLVGQGSVVGDLDVVLPWFLRPDRRLGASTTFTTVFQSTHSEIAP